MFVFDHWVSVYLKSFLSATDCESFTSLLSDVKVIKFEGLGSPEYDFDFKSNIYLGRFFCF